MLKVGLVFDDTLDSNDGVAQYVKTLGAWLTDNGHDVHYLVGETKISEWHGGRVHSLASNIRVSFNGNRLSIPLPSRRQALESVLRKYKFDVVHVMAPYSPFMGRKIIQLNGGSAPVVATFHIYPSGSLAVAGSKILYLVLRRSLNKVSYFISVSRAAAEFAKSSFNIKSDIIPNPVELEKFKIAAHKEAGDKKRIVFLGRLVKRKGAAELIRAFRDLYRIKPGVELIIAGDGPERAKLEKLVRRYELTNVVEFMGYIQEERKPALLDSADIACFPSLYGESFGIVLLEAMAAGAKVVLAGNNPGYKSVLGEQPQLLVEPLDTPEFTRRLVTLLEDKPSINRLNLWQRQHVKQYDINIVGEQILSIYNGQIALKRKTGNN